jgi:hypothetical protein
MKLKMKLFVVIVAVTVAVIITVSFAIIMFFHGKKMVETCAIYTGDMPGIEDTSPNCKNILVKEISLSACEDGNGKPIFDKTPGLGPFSGDRMPRSKYLGCSYE